MARVTGKALAARHGVDAKHALYRQTGDWFHLPRSFPAVLLDENGYIRFSTSGDFDVFIAGGQGDGIRRSAETNTLTLKDGISAHRLYVPFAIGVFPDEINDPRTVVEGARRQITVNAYERDSSARKLCIDRWGLACAVCGLDFGAVYGPIGAGFIHVHHLTPISSIKAEYVLTPERDMRPVCPNCHAMLHRQDPPLTIEELQTAMKPWANPR